MGWLVLAILGTCTVAGLVLYWWAMRMAEDEAKRL